MRRVLPSLCITLQSHSARLINSSAVTCKTHYAATKPSSDFKKRSRSKPVSFTEPDDAKKGEEKEEAPRIELHKSRGQHILTNPRVLKSIVDKAGVRETDTVLEIGPGTGNLTLELLQAARRVIAVEIDPRMIEAVHKRVQGTEMAQRLELVRGDILRTDLPSFDICVANIPYQISSPLIFKLLSTMPKFRNATLMLQKEFGRRLVAKPGDSLFNRLAVNVDLLASAKLLMDVSKRDFTPCPKVDSSVVRIEPRAWPPPVDLSEWNRFTLMCFTRKNKTLGAIFRQKKTVFCLMKKAELWHEKQKLKGSHDNLEKIVSDLSLLGELDDDTTDTEDIDVESDRDNEKFVCFKEKIVNILKSGGYEDKRSSKLSVKEFLRLISLFNKEGIHFS
uniref:rRNA adenine N(6)-methyltransferase n=1 Tax=Picea sitchensis TaxID=3332 RepID=D5AA35_PICSI|nr:unknown [Picea sitchensis]